MLRFPLARNFFSQVAKSRLFFFFGHGKSVIFFFLKISRSVLQDQIIYILYLSDQFII